MRYVWCVHVWIPGYGYLCLYLFLRTPLCNVIRTHCLGLNAYRSCFSRFCILFWISISKSYVSHMKRIIQMLFPHYARSFPLYHFCFTFRYTCYYLLMKRLCIDCLFIHSLRVPARTPPHWTCWSDPWSLLWKPHPTEKPKRNKTFHLVDTERSSARSIARLLCKCNPFLRWQVIFACISSCASMSRYAMSTELIRIFFDAIQLTPSNAILGTSTYYTKYKKGIHQYIELIVCARVCVFVCARTTNTHTHTSNNIDTAKG